ncbi:MAG TPA: LysM peptidoglycan-binding domain-containing protein [Pseudonocardiaceae bacterium]|jgi:LysM repeat protein|nr:LysM peptidoglycan-binding domain-containing protein [Pseudonocardiaceae bacterium]
MTVIANGQVRPPVVDLRVGGRRPVGPRRAGVRRPGGGPGAGHRPPRLVAAPRSARPVECPPWRQASGLGWLVLVGVLVFIVTLSVGWAGGGAPSAAPVPQTTALVQVRPQDTLWDIARRLAPASAPDVVVERIRQLNGLSDDVVRPGELLSVPDGVVRASGGAVATH